MDFDRIKVVLDVFHATLGVPGTEKIRAAALEELAEHNNRPDDQPELPLKGAIQSILKGPAK